ncbi:hypothetical protein HOY82DRAFT_618667 [Tuber indicum]|nr:hypothetical protein HOY82DRAFT_618667 [Tuber indicum]
MAFRKQPPQWPKGWLIILRILQLISTLAVVGITGFFSYHLVREDLGVPYEFIALDAIGVLTMLNILLSFILLSCRTLPPTLVLITDILLTLLWGVAFAFLARAMGSKTVGECSRESYGDYTVICHLYKILFAFSLLGCVLHLGTCWLAFRVGRKGSSRHAYKPAGDGAGIGLMGLSGSPGYKPVDGGAAGAGMMPPSVYKTEGGSAYGSGGMGENATYYGA